ncbi:MAG: Holliday junction resolvase RuvX, partial [Actinomycetota bacterium]
MSPATVLAIDPGTKRIGIAVSDPDRKLAFPLEVIERKAGWIDRVVGLLDEREVEEIVVGFPRRLDGSEGPAAEQARALAEALAARVDIPVRLVDERLTTAAADRALIGLGHRAPRR